MKKLEDYEWHAAECRAMATRAVGVRREQLLNMAATWEQLADTRRRKLLRLGKPAHPSATALTHVIMKPAAVG
jgi:hypothetical protein